MNLAAKKFQQYFLQKGKKYFDLFKQNTEKKTTNSNRYVEAPLIRQNFSNAKPKVYKNRSLSNRNIIFHSYVNVNKKSNSPIFNSNATKTFKLYGKKKIAFYISALFVLPSIIIALGAYFYLNSSTLYTVNLKYKYQNLTMQKVITANKDGSAGFSTISLNAEDGITVSGETTGQKILGEKSSGFISVFNATAEIKVIKKGTSVTCVSTACNGLVYTVESDLNLGPGSSATDLKIVASDIGENYNLAINAGRFRVANYNANTEVVASNIQPIAGGTPKKTVKIVSDEDLKKLEEKALSDLQKTLLTKIKLDPNNSSKYIFADQTLKIEKITSEGDPAGKETEIANMTVRAKGTMDAFSKDNLGSVIEEMKSSMAPEGYYLDEKTFNYIISPAVSDGNNISFTITGKGIARVNVNLNEVKNSIAGKNLEESGQVIRSLPNISVSSEEFSPLAMPDFLRRVPNDHQRIQIRLIAEDPEK